MRVASPGSRGQDAKLSDIPITVNKKPAININAVLRRPAVFQKRCSTGKPKGGFKLLDMEMPKGVRQGKYRCRENTLDSYVMQEISSYKFFLDLCSPSSVVLDIGGNIGTISVESALRGAKVFAFEPDDSNAVRFGDHVRMNDLESLVSLTKAVVMGPTYKRATAILYGTHGPNQGIHTTIPTRGRAQVECPAVTISRSLAISGADMAKVDIEGGEYELLSSMFKNKKLKMIIAELHFRNRDMRRKARKMMRLRTYSSLCWRCVRTPVLHTKAWTSMAIWQCS